MKLIKESIDIIISPLTCIINLSINSGIVPKQLKIARVIPLFKSGEQDIFSAGYIYIICSRSFPAYLPFRQ